jgi:hypothetical protein
MAQMAQTIDRRHLRHRMAAREPKKTQYRRGFQACAIFLSLSSLWLVRRPLRQFNDGHIPRLLAAH